LYNIFLRTPLFYCFMYGAYSPVRLEYFGCGEHDMISSSSTSKLISRLSSPSEFVCTVPRGSQSLLAEATVISLYRLLLPLAEAPPPSSASISLPYNLNLALGLNSSPGYLSPLRLERVKQRLVDRQHAPMPQVGRPSASPAERPSAVARRVGALVRSIPVAPVVVQQQMHLLRILVVQIRSRALHAALDDGAIPAGPCPGAKQARR